LLTLSLAILALVSLFLRYMENNFDRRCSGVVTEICIQCQFMQIPLPDLAALADTRGYCRRQDKTVANCRVIC